MASEDKDVLTKEEKEVLKMERVAEALMQVPADTNRMCYDMAQSSTEESIIQLFNQDARDLFDLLTRITRKINRESQYNISGYSMLFEQALSLRKSLPLSKFTLVILEFAPDIYAEDINRFINMKIPDQEINANNSFGLIRSEVFKQLWKVIDQEDRDTIKEKVIDLTVRAHTYFYKTTIINKQ